MKTQKQICIALDTAASRADLIDREPASSKQCWFLAGLIFKAGEDASAIDMEISNTQAILTKKAASFWIDQYLTAQTKAA